MARFPAAGRPVIAVAIPRAVSRMAARTSGLFRGGWCRGVGYGVPFGPPAFDGRGEPCGDVGMCATEDAEADVEEEGKEEDGDEDNGKLRGSKRGTVSTNTLEWSTE